MKSNNSISIFKKHLSSTQVYKGGKPKPKSNGRTIYKLSSNENMLGSSPKALKAVQNNINGLFEYPDRTDARLLTALSEFYNHELSEKQFITTNSGVAMLELIINAFLEPGLECIVSSPAFAPYMIFTEKTGAKYIDIPLEGDNFNLNINGILSAINDNTRLIFVTSPNNPTGTHIPKSQIDALIENLPSHVVLVIDEVYFQFADADDYVRPLPYVLEGKNVIGVNSFSKAYGLAGLRVGYAYATEEIARYVRQLRRPFMLNTLSLEAAIAALQDDEFIQKTASLIQTEKQYLYSELDKTGIKYWKTQANFILLQPEMKDTDFEAKMFEQGVMVRPVANFGAPGCIRVTIGTHEANVVFIEGLKRII
jgi:histidinol-phosphate aminotransferase